MGSSSQLTSQNDTSIQSAQTPVEKHTCDSCTKDSVITLAYGPHYFCEKHFLAFFENRVKKTVRKYKLIGPKEKILLALSGGKDSMALLYLLHAFYSQGRTIEALIIDEGVKGYRDNSVTAAVSACKKLGIKHHIISFEKEFGVTNDEIMPMILKNKKLGGTCAFCGTLRRNIMNKYAKKYGADKLATGHNLDDETQSFVMNVFNNDFERMKRMSAGSGIIDHEGFVKRIKPLYETPEKEIIAYCAYKGIEHYSQECCPYSWTAKRNEYREMLNTFENRFPGTKFSLLRFYENMRPHMLPEKKELPSLARKLHSCKRCGEPTERTLCKACEMIDTLKAEATHNAPAQTKTKRQTSKYNKALTCVSTKRELLH